MKQRQRVGEEEMEAYIRDRQFFPRELRNHHNELVFDLHPAKQLLRSDIKQGHHLGKKPKEVWESRLVYQDFPLAIFRSRIYQEIRRTKFINWLNEQRELGKRH